jgi:Tfp pilus assembly protein PilX
MRRPLLRPPRTAQRGVVLIFALITLVIMLIGAVAISRSMNSSQLGIGNIGFKRDLTNQSERAVQVALEAVRAGGALADAATRNSSLPAANYSAVLLPSNPQGIPLALLGSDTAFAAVGTTTRDITVSDLGINIRYVVDRMATSTGACSAATCTMLNDVVYGGPASEQISAQNNSSTSSNNPSAVTPQAVFRVSIRVTGPRNTQSFYQSTFTAD